MVYQQEYEKYRGQRALILTRVSGQAQAKKFGHPAQERRVREDITTPLMQQVIDALHCTYTGLEYQYNETLDHILRMAEEKKFDVLAMEVLDRGLGRKSVAREMYRMQLRDLGIHILTTEPSDHADDDSFEGLAARLRKGLKAEEEIVDMVRRTSRGRREKALGNPEEGILPQVVGNGAQRYGYKYIRNEKGTCIGYELNHDVVYVDKDGVEWKEVHVITFIFESVADGITLNKLAIILNEKGIPTSLAGKGLRQKNMKESPRWQSAHLTRIVRDTSYYGEYRYGQTVSVYVPGRKRPIKKATPPEEHIIVPIPAIVTKELWEKANRRVASNKQIATRNNKVSKDCLLRAGFAKCAYCGYSLLPKPRPYTRASGIEVCPFYYQCARPNVKQGRCPGCVVPVDLLDGAAMAYIRDIIRDPSLVSTAIQELLKGNPLKKQQQKKLRDLNKILQEQETLRTNLSKEMRKKHLSEQTIALLGRDLHDLEQQEKEARHDLDSQQQVQQQYEDLDQRLASFHQQCTEWREKLDTPEFQPNFHFYQEAVIFFGISVNVWKVGSKPPYEIRTRPPAIVELLS